MDVRILKREKRLLETNPTVEDSIEEYDSIEDGNFYGGEKVDELSSKAPPELVNAADFSTWEGNHVVISI